MIVDRKKVLARRTLNSAIAKGLIVRGCCEECGADHVDGHHDDYDKPLDVRWLCRRCHVRLHQVPLETRSRVMKRVWQDPDYRMRQDELRAKAWANDESRSRRLASIKKAYDQPETKKRHSDGLKKAWADPELRRRQGEVIKAAWARRKEKAA